MAFPILAIARKQNDVLFHTRRNVMNGIFDIFSRSRQVTVPRELIACSRQKAKRKLKRNIRKVLYISTG